MLNWISGLDPNLVATLLTAAGAGVVWVYHQIKGDKQESATDLVNSILANFAHELLDEYNGEALASYMEKARTKFEGMIWDVLAKRGVQKSSLLEPIVHLGVEQASQWLGSQLLAKANKLAAVAIPDQLATLQKQAASILKTIEDAQAKGLAAVKDLADQTVEKVP